MLGKTYSAKQLLETQLEFNRMMTVAQQELAQELDFDQKVAEWNNKLRCSVLESISHSKSAFMMPLPPADVLDELKKRNPDLELTQSSESDKLTVTILAE